MAVIATSMAEGTLPVTNLAYDLSGISPIEMAANKSLFNFSEVSTIRATKGMAARVSGTIELPCQLRCQLKTRSGSKIRKMINGIDLAG